MEQIKIEINKEIKRLDYYVKSNLERGKTERVKELTQEKELLTKVLGML